MPGARQNCLTAAVDNSSFSLLRLGPPRFILSARNTLLFERWLPISASSCSVSRYLGHGFQNRWLGDRSITTKSLSTVGRHRSICSMQIYHIFHSDESSCVFRFFLWRYIIFFAISTDLSKTVLLSAKVT